MSDETMAIALSEGGLILHPVRWAIISTLEDTGRPMYIQEIAEAIDEDRRLVSFHLATLEKKGYATSSFEIIEKANSLGKAGRYYSLTNKVKEVKKEITELLSKED